MNERIEQLARQAANGMLSYDAEGDWQLNGKEVEKFAELIVQECVFICKEKERPNLYGVREVEARIKEQFGVE